MEKEKELKYPKGEILRVRHHKGDTLMFITTEKTQTGYFFLYELVNGEFVRLGKATSPLELEAKFKVKERTGCI